MLISADFVTLDLAGFTIDGNLLFANGVASNSPNRQGIEALSGTVSRFGANGILGTGMRVENIRAFDNGGDGIFVSAGLSSLIQGHRIVANTANNNAQGIVVSCPAVVLENSAAGNQHPDILEIPAQGVCTSFENNPAP